MKKILILPLLFALLACHRDASTRMGATAQASVNPYWATPLWVVDPQNVSTCASDSNNGASATCGAAGIGPLRTYARIVQLWGTTCPTIAANVQVQWLSGQSVATDPVQLCSFTNGHAYLEMFAALPVTCTATLSNVTAKNRATGQLLQAQAGACLTGGDLAVTNLTHASVAWTYKNVSGSIYSMTQPVDTNGAYVAVDSWANGDSVQVGTPVQVNVRSISTPGSTLTPGFGFSIWLHDFTLWAPNGSDDTLIPTGGVLYMDEVRMQGGEFYAQSVTFNECDNCDFMNGTEINISGGIGTESSANHIWGMHRSGVDKFGNVAIGGDIILGSESSNGTHYIAGGHVGSVYLASGAELDVRSDTEMFSSFEGFPIGTAQTWGPGLVRTLGSSKLTYTAPAVNVFLNAGGLAFDTATTGCALDDTGDPAIWHCNRTMTPAHLDANVASGGFNGCAWGTHGAKVCVQ